MRRWGADMVLLVLGAALCVHGSEEHLRISLSAADAAAQWQTAEGRVDIAEGVLRLDGRDGHRGVFLKTPAFGAVELSATYQVARSDGVMAVGFVVGATDDETYTAVHFDARSAILYRRDAKNDWQEIKRAVKPQAPDTWHTAKLTVREGLARAVWNGAVVLEAPCTADKGLIGFYARQTVAKIKDVMVQGERAASAKPWVCIERVHGAPVRQQRAEIAWTKAICKQPGRYIGWPTACLRKNGELLVAFSGDRDAHVCPFGKVQMVKSTDLGQTWTAAQTVCNTQLDDRDAGILELPNGDLVITWFTSVAYMGSIRDRSKLKPGSPQFYWWLHDEKLPKSVKDEWLGYYTVRSADGGKTWEKPVKTYGSANHGPILLKDGRLLMVGRRWMGDGTSAVWKGVKHELPVEESRDNGRSWQVIASVEPAPPDEIGQFHEPHLVETDDGRLVAQFRFHAKPAPGKKARDEAQCLLRQAESSDGGKTWTRMAPTRIQGYPPHLLKLRSGKILTVYGRRLGPAFGEYACLSDDQGRTWDVANEIKLAGHFDGDLGYPASVELPDGSILTVYYQAEKRGEQTCLMGTLWRVK